MVATKVWGGYAGEKTELEAGGRPASGLVLLVKHSAEASHAHLVNLLDEAVINDVGWYTLLEADSAEAALMAGRQRHSGRH